MAEKSEDAKGANDGGQTMYQLRRELREEAIKMRNEMRDEFQRKLAEQMAEMRAQQSGAQRGGHHGGPRGRRASLSREAIVDTAMKIMNTRGLDKVTMRAIAHDLNTGPASIYVHVRSVVQLHGFMLDHLFSTIELSGGNGDWRRRVKKLLMDSMAVLLKHPELARSAVTARPTGDGSLLFVDRLLELLEEGDIPRARAAWGVDLLLLHATASAAEHSADDENDRHALDAFRDSLATDKYPHLSAAQDVIFAGSETERAHWAVDAILAGMTHTPVPGFD
jgi:AcrR family transcriptional regulator